MIHYKKFGKAPYKFVLVHGFPCNHTIWNNIIPELEKVGGGIAIDMPGVGDSKAIPNITLSIIADEILRVCDHEGMEQLHLIGHSMGGYSILNAATKSSKVVAMTLVHSGANKDSAERLKNRQKSIDLMEKGPREQLVFLSAMFKNFFAPEFNKSHPEIVTKYIDMANQVDNTVLCDLYKAIMLRNDSLEFISKAEFPIQFIIGDQDDATPIHELLPQTALPKVTNVKIYQNCGHGSFEECPDQLASDIINFHKYCYEQL